MTDLRTRLKELLKGMFHRHHPDDEIYDEIHITCQERYKTSGLSGDEWRFGWRVEFKFKGQVVFSNSFTRLSTAVSSLPWFFLTAGENGDTNVAETGFSIRGGR